MLQCDKVWNEFAVCSSLQIRTTVDSREHGQQILLTEHRVRLLCRNEVGPTHKLEKEGMVEEEMKSPCECFTPILEVLACETNKRMLLNDVTCTFAFYSTPTGCLYISLPFFYNQLKKG